MSVTTPFAFLLCCIAFLLSQSTFWKCSNQCYWCVWMWKVCV